MKTSKIILALMVGFVMSLFTAEVVQTVDPTVSKTAVALMALAITVGSVAVSIGYESKKFEGMAFTACSLITANIGTTCATPPTPGTKETVYIYNFDEVASLTLDGANDLIVTAITMATGKKGFKYVGYSISNEPKYEAVIKKFGPPKWKHTNKIRVFYWDPTTKKQIEKLVGAKVMSINENNEAGTAGETSFEMYGVRAGMYCASAVRDPSSTDDVGAFVIELASKDGYEEGQMPKTVFLTDYATTSALILATIT